MARIDQLTGIDLETANDVQLAQVTVAQYEQMNKDFPGWYAKDCLRLAKAALKRAEAKAAMDDLTATVRQSRYH